MPVSPVPLFPGVNTCRAATCQSRLFGMTACVSVCVCAPTLKTESYGLPYPIIINSTTQLSSLQADLYSVNNNKTFKLVLSTINSKY